MEVSVVTSLYRSSGYIEAFYSKMTDALKEVTTDYEIIFVDDGSPDNSADLIKAICEKDDKVKLVELAKNFGAAPARWEGMKHSTGDYVFLLDADLEEDPNLIRTFYKEIKANKDADVIYGYLKFRKGGLIERISGKLFYKIFDILTGIKFIGSPVWARLMSRPYVDTLLQFNEHHLFAIAFMSVLFIIYLAISKFFFLEYQDGWTSLIVSVFLIGGINLAGLGVIGLYIGKTFEQTKQRPRAIVRKTYNI